MAKRKHGGRERYTEGDRVRASEGRGTRYNMIDGRGREKVMPIYEVDRWKLGQREVR